MDRPELVLHRGAHGELVGGGGVGVEAGDGEVHEHEAHFPRGDVLLLERREGGVHEAPAPGALEVAQLEDRDRRRRISFGAGLQHRVDGLVLRRHGGSRGVGPLALRTEGGDARQDHEDPRGDDRSD